jgi:hypothetical protein
VIDRDELRAKAEAATPGPWWTGMHDGFSHTVEGSEADSHPVAQRLIQPDAEYIAAANPSVVLALLDALDAAHAEAKKAHDDLTWMAVELSWATDGRLRTAVGHAKEILRVRTDERDQARAALDAAERRITEAATMLSARHTKSDLQHMVIRALDALDAAERAASPSDEEREALIDTLQDSSNWWHNGIHAVFSPSRGADAILAAGWSRSVSRPRTTEHTGGA